MAPKTWYKLKEKSKNIDKIMIFPPKRTNTLSQLTNNQRSSHFCKFQFYHTTLYINPLKPSIQHRILWSHYVFAWKIINSKAGYFIYLYTPSSMKSLNFHPFLYAQLPYILTVGIYMTTSSHISDGR